MECGAWGTVTESIEAEKSKEILVAETKTFSLKEIRAESSARTVSGIAELDRVLGGGLVPGSLILIGGEPGIGKSTLALQMCAALLVSIYFSGEESPAQIKNRADRLGLSESAIEVASAFSVEEIIATIKNKKPKLSVIDSVQTLVSREVSGEAGNPNQVRAITVKLLETAKTTGVAIALIGHVTKEGMVAGPKTLEHLVDTVIYFEGDKNHSYRLLRAVKNRFGATDEIGVFMMTGAGLESVSNPSGLLTEDRAKNLSGSVLTCVMEGTRPLVMEIQALVNRTSFGYPVRKSYGFDLNRLHLLIAVLEKRAGINLAGFDVHLNVVGGIIVKEPAADLAVCLALASAKEDKILPANMVAFGEVGLGGEIRTAKDSDRRIKECQKLGLDKIITHHKKNLGASQDLVEMGEVKEIKKMFG